MVVLTHLNPDISPAESTANFFNKTILQTPQFWRRSTLNETNPNVSLDTKICFTGHKINVKINVYLKLNNRLKVVRLYYILQIDHPDVSLCE